MALYHISNGTENWLVEAISGERALRVVVDPKFTVRTIKSPVEAGKLMRDPALTFIEDQPAPNPPVVQGELGDGGETQPLPSPGKAIEDMDDFVPIGTERKKIANQKRDAVDEWGKGLTDGE